jgi:hypothetical protein
MILSQMIMQKMFPSLPTIVLLWAGDRTNSPVELYPIPSLIEGGEENWYRPRNLYCLP